MDFLTFVDKYSIFATMYVSLITIENGILGYLYNNINEDNLDKMDKIEDLDGIFFWIFVAIWIIGQILFVIIGFRTKSYEMRKLTMGTEQLNEISKDDTAKNYYFYRKSIDEAQYKQLNDLGWMTLIAEKRE